MTTQDVNVAAVVKRLCPTFDVAARAKVESYVSERLTRGGRPGEVDAVALVNEYLNERRTRMRMGDSDRLAEAEWRMDCLASRMDACWDGYEQRGTKEKNGKTVPNCVPAGK